jgi:DNA-binding MarR family transcriptional regulator
VSTRQPDPADAEMHALAGTLRVLIGQLRRKLRDQARPGDFSNTQIAILGRLERDGPATVTALAQAEGMRPQSMGATVAALHAAGFVKSAPHPTDGRQVLWGVTPKLRRWLKAHRAAREDWLFRSLQTGFTPAEQKKLAAAVVLLRRLVET